MVIQRQEFVDQFVDLSPDQQTQMLLSVSFELTLVARDVYGPSEYRSPSKLTSNVTSIATEYKYTDAMKLKFSYGLSEFNHQILGQLRKMVQPQARYPDDVFVEVLCDIAQSYEMEGAFDFVWRRAYSSVSGS